MQTTDILYLHGFNAASAPDGRIQKALEIIGDVTCLDYDPFIDYESNLLHLKELVSKYENPLVVGISLGGFYASKLAEYIPVKTVLINPGLNPFYILSPAVGVPMANFVTEKYNVLSAMTLHSYFDKHTNVKNMLIKPLVLLDSGDMLISAHTTKFIVSLDGADVTIFSGGDHFFRHIEESLVIIKTYIEKI